MAHTTPQWWPRRHCAASADLTPDCPADCTTWWLVRRVTRNFMHSVELDSHSNNLINMLINMLKSKNGVSVAKDFFTHRPARLQEFIQDASIYLPGAREHFLALRTVSTALSILLFATSCTFAICHHSC